jgi:HK97 family phage prohead protease
MQNRQNFITKNFVIKSSSDNNIIITGYASVYEVLDQHNDLIVKGAFAFTNTQNIKFLWQHDTQKPIGIIKSLSDEDHGLKIEAIINNKIEAGREAIELVRQGAVNGLSVGFNIIHSNYNQL